MPFIPPDPAGPAMPVVRPADQPGAWVQEANYRFRAETCLRLLDDLSSKSRAALAQLVGRRVPADVAAGVHEVQAVADAVVVFSAMAVEGFLNFYGVRRLGEEYYAANLERWDTTRKAAALVFHCTGTRPEPASALLLLTKAIADRRNALVHPKTMEAGTGRRLPDTESGIVAAGQAIEDMRRFFELFVAADPGAAGSTL